ncbi:MAG: discoidin domain-containing protein [Verrucomicrobiales bacterium]|nr:discoidin domain-containing protein [Verrucomicrobiales bacterium]
MTASLLASSAMAQDLVPLKTDLPKPVLVGTPVPIKIDNLEPAPKGERPPFLVPKGAVNLAKDKKVTSSDSEPLLGELPMITDGVKDGDEGNFVELADGPQWVQIDLGQTSVINAILLWHFHSQKRAYRDVVVQVSDDPDFISGATTVFNTKTKKDQAYVETYEGKLIDAKGAKGRYVRLGSNGNTTNPQNHYIEVEVWGVPAK